MSRRDVDWDALRAEWLYNADAASGTAVVERQMRAARRGAFGEEVIGSGIAAAAVAFVALALRHAANPLEAALGIVVGAAICFIWLRRRDLARQEQRSLEERAADYLRIIRVVRQRQARLAQFIWAVIALDLVFLIPWWVIGSRVHSRRLGDIGSIETMWLPLLGMALLGAWAARMRRRALREAAAIARMQRSVWADVD
jgi:hypothetical protein